VKANQAEHAVDRMCELLGVSTSGYYAWLRRPPSVRELLDRELTETIIEIWKASDRTYGAPRITPNWPTTTTFGSGRSG
jgi:putative transposase